MDGSPEGKTRDNIQLGGGRGKERDGKAVAVEQSFLRVTYVLL